MASSPDMAHFVTQCVFLSCCSVQGSRAVFVCLSSFEIVPSPSNNFSLERSNRQTKLSFLPQDSRSTLSPSFTRSARPSSKNWRFRSSDFDAPIFEQVGQLDRSLLQRLKQSTSFLFITAPSLFSSISQQSPLVTQSTYSSTHKKRYVLFCYFIDSPDCC
jgi:hypothetical protein